MAAGIGNANHARAIGGQLMKPRNLRARVTCIRVAAQHAGDDAMPLICQRTEGSTAAENLIVRVAITASMFIMAS